MARKDRESDEGGIMTTLSVFDLDMASAYYACVFDAEIDKGPKSDVREMKIGRKQFLLKQRKSDPQPHDPYIAEVEDADVCVARGAAHGGTIIDAVAVGPDLRRTGAIRDPFGLSWRVRKKT